MLYENVKVLDINPTIYLGEECKNNDWKINEQEVVRKLKRNSFDFKWNVECPIDDMVLIGIENDDKYEPIIKTETIDHIFTIINKALEVFNPEQVKIQLYLDGYIDEIGNCIDLNIKEFISWLEKETRRINKDNDIDITFDNKESSTVTINNKTMNLEDMNDDVLNQINDKIAEYKKLIKKIKEINKKLQ